MLYFVKQIGDGGYFGLDELVEICKLKLAGNDAEVKNVKRKVKVTTQSNCKLAYMTLSSFSRLFGENELKTLGYYKTEIDV